MKIPTIVPVISVLFAIADASYCPFPSVTCDLSCCGIGSICVTVAKKTYCEAPTDVKTSKLPTVVKTLPTKVTNLEATKTPKTSKTRSINVPTDLTKLPTDLATVTNFLEKNSSATATGNATVKASDAVEMTVMGGLVYVLAFAIAIAQIIV